MAYAKLVEDSFTGTAGSIYSHVPELHPFGNWKWDQSPDNYNGSPALDGSGRFWDSQEASNYWGANIARVQDGSAILIDPAEGIGFEVEFVRVGAAVESGNTSSVSMGTAISGIQSLSASWNPTEGVVYIGWDGYNSWENPIKQYAVTPNLASMNLAVKLVNDTIVVSGGVTDTFTPTAGGARMPDRISSFGVGLSKYMRTNRVAFFASQTGMKAPIFIDTFDSGSYDAAPLTEHTPDLPFPGLVYGGYGLQVRGPDFQSSLTKVDEDYSYTAAGGVFPPVPVGNFEVQLGVLPAYFSYETTGNHLTDATLWTPEGHKIKFQHSLQEIDGQRNLGWTITSTKSGQAPISKRVNYSGTYSTGEVQYIRAIVNNEFIEIYVKGGYYMTPGGAEKQDWFYGDFSHFEAISEMEVGLLSGGSTSQIKYLRIIDSPDNSVPAADPVTSFFGIYNSILGASLVGAEFEISLPPSGFAGQQFEFVHDILPDGAVVPSNKVGRQFDFSWAIRAGVGKEFPLSMPMELRHVVGAQFDLHWLLSPPTTYTAHIAPHITL